MGGTRHRMVRCPQCAARGIKQTRLSFGKELPDTGRSGRRMVVVCLDCNHAWVSCGSAATRMIERLNWAKMTEEQRDKERERRRDAEEKFKRAWS